QKAPGFSYSLSDGQGGVEGVAGGLHGVAGGLAGFADDHDLRHYGLEGLFESVVGAVAHGQHDAVMAAHGALLAGDGVGVVHAVGVEVADAGVHALGDLVLLYVGHDVFAGLGDDVLADDGLHLYHVDGVLALGEELDALAADHAAADNQHA